VVQVEMKKKLACPKCKRTFFEVFLIRVSGFFYYGSPLVFTLSRCINCGWESHPTETGKLKEIVAKLLRGEVPQEGFILAE